VLQKEHDALLLELFDARQALEETRRELSQALYQNDAAVRVISRLVMERDAAHAKLQNIAPQQALTPAPQPMEVEVETEAEVKEEPQSNKIGEADMSIMVETWKKLSKTRKKRAVAADYPQFDTISTFAPADTKSNLHKTNKPGSACLTAVPKTKLVVSGGNDKIAVVYDGASQTVVGKLSGHSKAVTSVDATEELIVTGSADGSARCYRVQHASSDDSGVSFDYIGSVDVDGGACAGVCIHPTGKYVIVASSVGKIVFCRVNISSSSNGDEDTSANAVQQLVVFDTETTVTCIGMHPDGLILGAGTADGKLKILDLKSQKFASTLEGHNGAVTSLSFSENGYHFSSSSDAGEVNVWDLRKLKLMKTLTCDAGAVYQVQFDFSGKNLAYTSGKGVTVCVVKDWEKSMELVTDTLHKNVVMGIVWGLDGQWIASAGKDRNLVLWGVAAQDAGS